MLLLHDAINRCHGSQLINARKKPASQRKDGHGIKTEASSRHPYLGCCHICIIFVVLEWHCLYQAIRPCTIEDTSAGSYSHFDMNNKSFPHLPVPASRAAPNRWSHCTHLLFPASWANHHNVVYFLPPQGIMSATHHKYSVF